MCEQKQKRIQVFRDKRKEVASEIRKLRADGCSPHALSDLSRHLHLVCGFFRHRPYLTIEATARTSPYWNGIRAHVQTYGVTKEEESYESEMARLEAWVQEAKDHYEKHKIKK